MPYGDDFQLNERERQIARREEAVQNFKEGRYVTWTVVVAVVVLTGLGFGGAAGCSSYNRYQSRANTKNDVVNSQVKAHNQVKLNEIEIGQQQQRVKIEQQKAEIRRQKAVGIREAQDEISKTLTPLYVQFEMSEALKDIAVNGKNSSVIYIPTGANGLPIVAPAKP